MCETLTADVDTEYGRVATDASKIGHIAREMTEGDTLEVEYVSGNGLTVTTTFTIRRAFDGDAWGSDGEYLHVNTSTGDYHFQDPGRERHPDGRELETVTLRKRGDA